MLVAERTRLGDAFDEWLKRQRVSVAHVERIGGVSRNVMILVPLWKRGTERRPGNAAGAACGCPLGIPASAWPDCKGQAELGPKVPPKT